jgi:hypothetical protein
MSRESTEDTYSASEGSKEIKKFLEEKIPLETTFKAIMA